MFCVNGRRGRCQGTGRGVDSTKGKGARRKQGGGDDFLIPVARVRKKKQQKKKVPKTLGVMGEVGGDYFDNAKCTKGRERDCLGGKRHFEGKRPRGLKKSLKGGGKSLSPSTGKKGT